MKEKMLDYITHNIKKTICFFGILIIGIILCIFINAKASENTEEPVIKLNIEEPIKEEEKYITVDIKGMITNPGVYKMTEGERVNDVILKAGGLLEEANTSVINLSKILEDEMVIIIYSNEEIEKYKEANKTVPYIEMKMECECPDTFNSACVNESITDISSKVSINTAGITELTTLSGIGESKALAIIEYRNNNGLFKTIEDLKNVSGIGDAAFEKIKDYITI